MLLNLNLHLYIFNMYGCKFKSVVKRRKKCKMSKLVIYTEINTGKKTRYYFVYISFCDFVDDLLEQYIVF